MKCLKYYKRDKITFKMIYRVNLRHYESKVYRALYNKNLAV